MNLSINYDQCLSFLNTQIKPAARAQAKSTTHFRAVTLSRETGSGGNAVAERLIAILSRSNASPPSPWAVFDKNLVEKVLEDHQLPGRLAKFFPEDRLLELKDMMDDVFGLLPDGWKMVEHTSETMLHLAALGNVVLVGRAGNIVTRKLPDVLHVRLVGSLETRARRLSEIRGMTRRSSLDLIAKEDTGRRRYVKKYFNADIDDPKLYHLVINTDLVSIEGAANMLGRIVVDGF
jgi:hypothetical protein